MRLPDVIIDLVKKARVTVYYADRRCTRVWNDDRAAGEPITYGGWYWHRTTKNGVTETDADGPFRSESAAIRDAWKKLQLR